MKFQASLPTVSFVLAYPRFPAIMLWGPLPLFNLCLHCRLSQFALVPAPAMSRNRDSSLTFCDWMTFGLPYMRSHSELHLDNLLSSPGCSCSRAEEENNRWTESRESRGLNDLLLV